MADPIIIVIDLDDEDLQDDLYQAALDGTLVQQLTDDEEE